MSFILNRLVHVALVLVVENCVDRWDVGLTTLVGPEKVHGSMAVPGKGNCSVQSCHEVKNVREVELGRLWCSWQALGIHQLGYAFVIDDQSSFLQIIEVADVYRDSGLLRYEVHIGRSTVDGASGNVA